MASWGAGPECAGRLEPSSVPKLSQVTICFAALVVIATTCCRAREVARPDNSKTREDAGISVASSAVSRGEKGPLADDDIRQIVEEFARRMGFEWATYAFSGEKWYVNEPRYSWDYRLDIVAAGDFDVDLSSGTILRASHYRGHRPGKWEFGTLPEDKAPLRPARMSRGEVMSRAEAFFKRLDEDLLGEAELKVVKYLDERCNPWNYAWWQIRWRPWFHGYPCIQDFYQVTWYDDDVFSGFIRTIATPPRPPVVKMGARRAQKLSTAERIWRGLQSRYRVENPQLVAPTPKLWWVRPLPILDAPAFQLPEKPPAKFIRLAWVVLFRANISGTEDEVQVWIDAEDGEFLGANFVAH